MDPTNYAGIKGKTLEEMNTQEDDDEDKENEEETVKHPLFYTTTHDIINFLSFTARY